MSYTIYIYGTEVHDTYHPISYEHTEAEAWNSAGDGGQGYPWISKAITCIEDCKHDPLWEAIYTTAGNRIIDAQIVKALRAKRLARDVYVAPSLADLWPA